MPVMPLVVAPILLKYELLRGKGHSKYSILTAETLLDLQLEVRDLIVTKELL